MIPAVLAGLLAGLAHVFSGPDHLTAVAPIAIRDRGRGWRSGLLWGLGHVSGVALLAVVALFLREALVERLSAMSERLVGVVLIGIGLWALRGLYRHRVHAHEHTHEADAHTHLHVHEAGDHPAPHRHSHTHAAFGVGALHGLAGASHLFAILPALAFPGLAQAVAYLAGYGAASVVAMTVFSYVLGKVVGTHRRGERAYRTILGTAALASIGVGVFWLTL